MCPHLNNRIFLVVVVLWISVSLALQDYDILKFEMQQFSDLPARGTFKMFRGAQRITKFNFTVNVTSNDLSIYDIEAFHYHSSLGNNQFTLSPFRLSRKPFCDALNNEYRARFMDDLAAYSNLPCEHDTKVNLCDLVKKGDVYEIVNYRANTSLIDNYFPTGIYKLYVNLIDRNTNSNVISVLSMSKLY